MTRCLLARCLERMELVAKQLQLDFSCHLWSFRCSIGPFQAVWLKWCRCRHAEEQIHWAGFEHSILVPMCGANGAKNSWKEMTIKAIPFYFDVQLTNLLLVAAQSAFESACLHQGSIPGGLPCSSRSRGTGRPHRKAKADWGGAGGRSDLFDNNKRDSQFIINTLCLHAGAVSEAEHRKAQALWAVLYTTKGTELVFPLEEYWKPGPSKA